MVVMKNFQSTLVRRESSFMFFWLFSLVSPGWKSLHRLILAIGRTDGVDTLRLGREHKL